MGFKLVILSNYYKNSILFGFSYSLLIPITINDYPIFRLGLDTFYQSLTAKQVETTKMKNYSFIGFIKIGYFFIPEKLGFWSNFYPYFRAGYGQNVTILSTKSGSESNDDMGLDPLHGQHYQQPTMYLLQLQSKGVGLLQ